MTDFKFLTNQELWFILVIAVLFLIVFIWKEYKQSRLRLVPRIIVSVVAVISLVLLILKPVIESKANTSILVILTKNYNEKKLDSLKKLYKKLIGQIENGLKSHGLIS